MNVCGENVSKAASGESSQNVVDCAKGGAWQLFAEVQAMSERSRAKRLQPVVLTEMQGKGKCGKEAFLLT
ncbi:hypothetical protein [Mucilaginibacter sp.]